MTIVERRPFKCPVCEGRGFLLESFYTDDDSTASGYYVTCRTCSGKGIVWGAALVPEKAESEEDETELRTMWEGGG